MTITDPAAHINGVVDVASQSGVPEADPSTMPTCRTFPNPFIAETHIVYELQEPATVTLAIYDVSGRPVRTMADHLWTVPGRHQILWDGRNEAGAVSPPGVYVYRLDAGANRLSGRVTKLR